MNIGTKYITALYYVIFAGVLQGSIKCDDFDFEFRLAEEVVSIYGDKFDTPKSRESYFIKVHRCITGKNFGENLSQTHCWPKAAIKEIEIVVPDINNNKKFYKYIVYNHTSCTYYRNKRLRKCDSGPGKQHKSLPSHEVNETEFNEKYPKNPVNLRNCNTSSFCSEPQPRYKTSDEYEPPFNYLLYHQCLPGCKSTTESYVKNVTKRDQSRELFTGKTDVACSQYRTMDALQGTSAGQIQNRQSDVTESEDGFSIYIGSPKVLLAALLLSLILLSILIVDFNLCHRKKGLFYTLLSCKNDTMDRNCSDCARRQQEINEIV